MTLDRVCYSVVYFCRVILYVWSSPPVFSMSVSDEYLVKSTIIFVSGCL